MGGLSEMPISTNRLRRKNWYEGMKAVVGDIARKHGLRMTLIEHASPEYEFWSGFFRTRFTLNADSLYSLNTKPFIELVDERYRGVAEEVEKTILEVQKAGLDWQKKQKGVS